MLPAVARPALLALTQQLRETHDKVTEMDRAHPCLTSLERDEPSTGDNSGRRPDHGERLGSDRE
ncbi:MAG: hypothetical protein ACR2RF_05080 [Geminicoccaceae bacterium]